MREYKQLDITICGNRKTSNAIDPVRGCSGAHRRTGGCYHSCYANKLAKISGVNFGKPVINTYNESKLKAQLEKNKASWMRIGVTGDPSASWENTAKVCHLVRQSGKTPVVMTKAWERPTKTVLKSLARDAVHLQVGLSALDTYNEETRRKGVINDYSLLYRPGTFAKVMTLPFSDIKLAKKQDSLVGYAKYYRFMELPLRIFSNAPYADKVSWDLMRHHWNAISKQHDTQYTAGPLYSPKSFIEELQANKSRSYYLCGEVTCDTCPHCCGTQ